jgi:uncharacterized protein (TIGR02145 family)
MKKVIIVFILGMPFLGSSQTIQNVNKTNGTSSSNNISTIDSIIFPAGGGQMQINLNNATPVIHQLQDIVNVNFFIGGVYTGGSVFCNGTPTVIVDVTNPTTGEIWMDRNLGAAQAATSSTDANSYGDLYQWGRRSDGHQCRTSATTTTLSSTDQPANGSFILAPSSPSDWRSPQNNNLWQGVNGVNNPCPGGYRLPTEAELEAERLSWSSNNAQGAFASALKLPVAGSRNYGDGSLNNVGTSGRYWSSTVIDDYSQSLAFNSSNAYMIVGNSRAFGFSVRCLKDVSNPQGSINNLDCGSTTNNGTLTQGTLASGVSSLLPYTGGNGGTHNGQTVTSTGVTGLTATLAAGIFANGAGSLTYTISGAPSASGTASFALNIGGQSCNLNLAVNNAGGSGTYPPNSVFCTGTPTVIVDVTNPATGRIWMDRNLGATQVATSSTDANAYGDLYQWGRRSDGHQCRNSATTTTLSSTDQPANGSFIITTNDDWRSPSNNNLWQGVNGVNNPCPSGYRLPTEAELETERLSWSSNDALGAFASALKLTVAGLRISSNGSLGDVGTEGNYWSSSVNGVDDSHFLFFGSLYASMGGIVRAYGFSVRCLKD